MAAAYYRPNQCGGGDMILINDLKQVKFTKINTLSLEGQFEACATLINVLNFEFIVMNTYSPPYDNDSNGLFYESLWREL